MNKKLLSAFVIPLVIFQLSLQNIISIKGAAPDLFLIILVLILTRQSRKGITGIGFILGFAQDIFSGGVLGVFMLSKVITAYILKTIYPKKFTPSVFLYILLLFFSALIHETVHLVCLSASFHDWGMGMLRYGLPSVFYMVMIGLPVIFGFSRLCQTQGMYDRSF